MVNDIIQGVETNLSETDIFVSVLACSRNIFAVINVKYSDLILADYAVEVCDDFIKMVNDVIAAVACVAGVKADPEFIVVCYSVINPGKLLKGTTDFRAFSGHCFQRDHAVCIAGENLVETFDDLSGSGFSACADMGAGVENQCVAPAAYRAVDFLCEKLNCKFERFRFYGVSEIDNVRGVDDDFGRCRVLSYTPMRAQC